MNISYSDPLSRGWNRMKKALFQPFDISKWFTVGFTAFLATLGEFTGGGGGNSSSKYGRSRWDWDEFARFPETALEWLTEHTLWFALIIFGVVVIFALIIVFTWLSSRGKFMFLDNVIFDKAEVTKPWHEFRKQGDSLFLWRLVFGFICFALIMLSLIFSAGVLINLFTSYTPVPAKIFSIMGLVLQFLVLIIVISYISLFLNDFIVPIMYKYKISATRAWGKFLPLLSRHIGYFILYGLFIFVLGLLVAICVVLFGLFTCCIGFLLLIIPYIGSVVLLPVTYTFRAFSVEFLEQFGDEYSFFPNKDESTVDSVQA